MTDGVTQVMREGSYGESQFVDRVSILKLPNNEIAGSDIVGQIAEQTFAERVITHILNSRAAVSVCVRLDQLLGCRAGDL